MAVYNSSHTEGTNIYNHNAAMDKSTEHHKRIRSMKTLLID